MRTNLSCLSSPLQVDKLLCVFASVKPGTAIFLLSVVVRNSTVQGIGCYKIVYLHSLYINGSMMYNYIILSRVKIISLKPSSF